MKAKDCTYCGNELDTDELQNPEKDQHGQIMCDSCYDREYRQTCPLCEESYEKPTRPKELYFVVAKEASEDVAINPIKPGIYQTTDWPYFLGATGMGFEILFENSIKLIRELDINSILKKLHQDSETIGADEICPECVEKYTNINYKKRLNYCDKDFKLHHSIYERGIINLGK